MEEEQICHIIEAALLASDGPLTVANITRLFAEGELDEENATKQIREAIKQLQEQTSDRGVELKRVASGYRYQVRQDLSPWVSRLWDEKPPRYTRALLETLALVAYKQPVTRGDIEQVRGVSVSQSIMRTLVERDWIRIVGQREVPGRPALYGTTKAFLDYFNLKSLDELPPMAEIRALIEPTLVEEEVEVAHADASEQIVEGVAPAETQASAETDATSEESELHEAQENEVADDGSIHAHVEIAVTEDAQEVSPSAEISDAEIADDQSSAEKIVADAEIDVESSGAEVVQLHGNAHPNG